MSKTLVIFAKGFEPDDGGIERYSTRLAAAIATQCKTIVITQHSGPAGTVLDADLTVHNVGTGSQIVVFFRMMWLWLRLSRSTQIDYIFCTTWRLALPPVLAFARAPIGIAIHGREVIDISPIMKGLMNWIFQFASLKVPVSKTTQDFAWSHLAPKSRKGHWVVSWNGLSFDGKLHCNTRTFDGNVNILSFCRIVGRKNIPAAIRVVDTLYRSGVTNIVYTIAGGGKDLSAVRAQVADMGAESFIKVLGRVGDDEIPRLYASADIFLHPQIAANGGADFEGFGLTIADAMSFAVPPIVGVHGGPAEFVSNRRTGLVVDGTNERAILEALGLLVSQPGYRRQLGQAAKQFCSENLSWDRVAGVVLEGFESIN